MPEKHGSLSINSENIFPVIKKWLYSDHDIFYRELVSNGCDAITKLKKLDAIGEYSIPEDLAFSIQIYVDSEEKTIRFVDNGIGMSESEVEEYINQIAFSGAQKFMETYKDKTGDDQIIGHFGLGFYSAFMVADRVTINTKSYRENEPAVFWESEGGTEFAISDGDRTEPGTEITLYLNEDSYEFCNEYRAREVLNKYCSFMPVEIYLNKVGAEPEYEEIETEETDADGNKIKEKVLKAPKPINDIHPLWAKHPNDCTEEEYKEFYRNVFHDYKEPLFWIHLNMDYPFNLKGILYFPKLNLEYESAEGVIKLYNNQVFIADNIKEVIPEFLMLLKGAIDCPDLPLNVSRSALQNDGFVRKISDYIAKKVADKLTGMMKTERESYEKYWDDIAPFIKYGCLKDEKFSEKVISAVLFKDLDGKYLTLEDARTMNGDAHKDEIAYVSDAKEQSQYIKMYRDASLNAVYLPHQIDSPFMSMLEQKNEGLKFVRVDSDLSSSMKEEGGEGELAVLGDKLTDLFHKVLSKENLEVKVERLKDTNIASVAILSEEGRRMQDMMKMYGMDTAAMGNEDLQLVLNSNHPLVNYCADHPDSDLTPTICEHLYDLALLGHGTMDADTMTRFIQRSNEIMERLTDSIG